MSFGTKIDLPGEKLLPFFGGNLVDARDLALVDWGLILRTQVTSSSSQPWRAWRNTSDEAYSWKSYLERKPERGVKKFFLRFVYKSLAWCCTYWSEYPLINLNYVYLLPNWALYETFMYYETRLIPRRRVNFSNFFSATNCVLKLI